jgi:hypothetical protein
MDANQAIDFRLTYVRQKEPSQAKMHYDRPIDTLFIDLLPPGGPRSTYYVADGVNIVYDPRTKEVVGFRVEDWRRLFLRRNPDLRLSWYVSQLLCWVDILCVFLKLPQFSQTRIVQRVESVSLV